LFQQYDKIRTVYLDIPSILGHHFEQYENISIKQSFYPNFGQEGAFMKSKHRFLGIAALAA